jgi:hypothetical protein
LNPSPFDLGSFEEVDEAAFAVRSGDQVLLRADELSLGPFFEALVLRKSLKGISLDARGGQRGELLRLAAQSRHGCAFSSERGAFYMGARAKATDDMSIGFAEAIARCVQQAGIPDKARLLLKGAVVELISNIPQHAGEGARGVAGFEMTPTGVAVTVADSGHGIVAGYVNADPELHGLSADDALVMAVVNHKSRFAKLEPGRGTGFNTVMNVLRSLDATLRVRSGDASIQSEGDSSDPGWALREQVELRGFVVSLNLKWR